jgi:hypothetical protein
MDFVNELENKIFEILQLKKPDNLGELYMDFGHRLLQIPKNKGEQPEKTIEIIANTAESFLELQGFKIFNKLKYFDTPYKTQNMCAEKHGIYYAFIIGGKQDGNSYKMSIIHIDFPNKN